MDEPSVSIPLPLFDEQQLEHYLKTAVEKDEKTIAQKNVLQALDQVVVFNVNTAWNKLFKEYFPK